MELQETKLDNREYWYNERKQEYEFIETPTDFTDYIPQIPAAQNMYSLLIKMEKQPIDAAIQVLRAVCGKTKED